MKQSIKSKAILFTLLFTVIFTVTLIFATNSFATEEINEADVTPSATEEEAVIEESPEALPETSETNEAAVTEPAAQPNLDMVETPLGTSGLKLIGDRAAQSPSDYEESAGNYIIKSEGWTISGTSILRTEFTIKCNTISLENLGQTSEQKAVQIYVAQDEAYRNTNVNIKGENVNVFNITGKFSFSVIGSGSLDLGATNQYNQRAGAINCQQGDITIDGPSISLNVDSLFDIPSPVFSEGGNIIIKSGSLKCTVNSERFPAILALGSIEVSDNAELFAASKYPSCSVASYSEDGFGDISRYKTSSNFFTYDQKSQVVSSPKIISEDVGGGFFVYYLGIDGTETPAMTVYKPSGNEPTPPTPPNPDPEEYNSAQTGDSPLAGIVMLIAVASGICFASVNIRRTLKK